MAQVTNKQQDKSVPDAAAAISYQGLALSAREHMVLWDVFEGATLDTDKWSAGTASGGTVTQSAGLTLATSTNTAGQASILSQVVPIFLPFAEMSFRSHLRFVTAPIASNTREMTLKVDGNNYAQFLANGTDWIARVYANGAPVGSDVAIGLHHPGSLAYLDLDMRIMPEAVYFIVNGDQVASFTSRGRTSRLWQTGVLAQAYFRTLNAGDATDNKLEIRSTIVTRRFAEVPGFVRAKKMTADGIVARGPCWYLGAMRIANTGGAAVIYDNTAASGTIIDEYTTAAAARSTQVMAAPIECMNGIYVDLTTDSLIVYYAS